MTPENADCYAAFTGDDHRAFEQIGNVDKKIIFLGHAIDERTSMRFKQTTEMASKKDRHSLHLDTTKLAPQRNHRRRLVSVGSSSSSLASAPSTAAGFGAGTAHVAPSSIMTSSLMSEKPSFGPEVLRKLERDQQKNQSALLSAKRAELASGTGASDSLKSKLGIRRQRTSGSVAKTSESKQRKRRKTDSSSSSSSTASTTPIGSDTSTPPGTTTRKRRAPTNVTKFLEDIKITSLFEQEPRLQSLDYSSTKLSAPQRRPVTSQDECNEYIREFDNKYPEYCLLSKQIDDNKELFTKLYDIFSSTNANAGQKKLAETKLKQLYEKRSDEMDKVSKRFNMLHEDLQELKAHIVSFVEEQKNSSEADFR